MKKLMTSLMFTTTIMTFTATADDTSCGKSFNLVPVPKNASCWIATKHFVGHSGLTAMGEIYDLVVSDEFGEDIAYSGTVEPGCSARTMYGEAKRLLDKLVKEGACVTTTEPETTIAPPPR